MTAEGKLKEVHDELVRGSLRQANLDHLVKRLREVFALQGLCSGSEKIKDNLISEIQRLIDRKEREEFSTKIAGDLNDTAKGLETQMQQSGEMLSAQVGRLIAVSEGIKHAHERVVLLTEKLRDLIGGNTLSQQEPGAAEGQIRRFWASKSFWRRLHPRFQGWYRNSGPSYHRPFLLHLLRPNRVVCPHLVFCLSWFAGVVLWFKNI